MSDFETLVDLLRQRAGQNPERVAYTFLRDGDQDETTLSYGALDRHARALAVRLRELGASGSRALLLLPPGLQYITSFFGCLYAGMIAVPGYLPRGSERRRRMRAIGRDAGAAVVIAESRRAGVDVFGDHMQPACLDLSVLPEVPMGHDSWRRPDLAADSISHLQYTSGSTSAPRGVVLTHRETIWQLRTLAALNVGPRRRVVSWLPPNHDMGLFLGILVPMYHGRPATLMAPLAFVKRPGRWLAAIARYGADVSVAPNFGYELAVAKTTAAEREQWDLSCWAVALNGAEPVHPDTLRRFAEAFAPCGFRREALLPGYGLAEAALMVSLTRPSNPLPAQTFDAAALRAGRVVPAKDVIPAGVHALASCGPLAPGFQVCIVDPISRRPCSAGVVGEIWLRGPSIAAGGYWGRQRLTARTFHARPVGTRETGFLRTGDLGFCHDGELFVVGRSKDVIIVHGENHHPHDLERLAERAHAACRRGGCAAFASSWDGQERVVVVQEVRHDASPLEVVGQIRRALVTGCGVDVDTVALVRPGTVPKTTSGKTRRAACRADFETGALPMLARDDRGEDPEPPKASGDSAAYLRQQVAALLGIPPTEVAEHAPPPLTSLMAAALANRVERDFGVELSMAAFLDGRDITALAQTISRGQAAGTSPARRRSRPRQASAEPVVACSAAQQRIWFQEQVMPGTPGYNVPVTLRLDGPLDIDVLDCCVQEIVRRHEALRTCFTEVDGQPIPVVAPQLTVPITVRDLAATSNSGAVDAPPTEQAVLVEERALRLVHEATTTAFDLTDGPLLRAQIIRLAPHHHLFALVVHHIICDGWSARLFLRELAELYRAFRQGSPSPLPTLPLQYTDFVRDQQRRLTGGVLRRELRHWRGVLANAPATSTLLPDRPGPPSTTTVVGLRLPFTLSAQLCADLSTLAEQRRTTPFMVLAAGLVALLHSCTDQDDLVIGIPVANRGRVETEDLIGMFVNTLPLRVSVAGNPSFGGVLQRVRHTMLAALAHPETPFDRLVADLRQRRESGRNPLFQILLAVQDIPIAVPDIPGLAVSSVSFDGISGFDLPLCTATLDLTICLNRDDEGLTGHVEFNSARYRADTVRLLLDRYAQLLHRVVIDPDLRLSDVLVEPTKSRAAERAQAPIDMALRALRLADSGWLGRQ